MKSPYETTAELLGWGFVFKPRVYKADGWWKVDLPGMLPFNNGWYNLEIALKAVDVWYNHPDLTTMEEVNQYVNKWLDEQNYYG